MINNRVALHYPSHLTCHKATVNLLQLVMLSDRRNIAMDWSSQSTLLCTYQIRSDSLSLAMPEWIGVHNLHSTALLGLGINMINQKHATSEL